MDTPEQVTTQILPVNVANIGKATAVPNPDDILDDIEFQFNPNSTDVSHLRQAAWQLKHSDIAVAFPTETVYGLGADATRSAAVNGIYKAKRRPADNPLIVHFSSLEQVRRTLRPAASKTDAQTNGHATNGVSDDPIPQIYRPLIERFWPGPLTIILPNPANSQLAPEVTAGVTTFGARIPAHTLALALIQLSDRPIAAPSANASTKPSPTAAEHVAHDLDGRIETIIDGGPCAVGVESTVVDGLSQPPLVLRPGGISIEQLRTCPGWEDTQVGYKDVSEKEHQPKAPGMKYRHYSPRATVVLYEAGKNVPSLTDLGSRVGPGRKVGIVTTKGWEIDGSGDDGSIRRRDVELRKTNSRTTSYDKTGFAGMLEAAESSPNPRAKLKVHSIQHTGQAFDVVEIALGNNTADIARGIFSALRELDQKGVDAIFVEGIDESEGNTAAAVMNRLWKAAEVEIAG